MLPPTSPGPQRSPTDISLAQLVPTDEAGEASGTTHAAAGVSGDHVVDVIGLGLRDAANPPPEYTSPEHSDADSTDDSDSETDHVPLIRGPRARGVSSAATIRPNPPIPSYSDAIRQGAGRDRSRSDVTMGRRSGS